MNREMVMEISNNFNTCSTCTDDELSKSIIVQVDKGLLDKEKKITNELIEIAYSDLYNLLAEKLMETVYYIKKVNLDKPFKQNLIGRFMGTDLEADYLSPTVWLYTCISDMVIILPSFDVLFNKLNEVENEFQNMISSNKLSDITVVNKTSLLAQMEGLKHMKLSLLTLYDCYGLVLKNPQIKSYFTRWLNYKKRAICRIDSKYNQEMTEYNESMLSKINKL